MSILAIDAGTTGVTVLVVTPDGLIAAHSSKRRMDGPDHGLRTHRLVYMASARES